MDTEPEIRKLAAFMLTRQGYTILEARNRLEAISLFERHGESVELLLLEAKGRGRELGEQLREGYPQTALLLLCSEGSRNAAEAPQGPPVLKKPFTMAQIAGKVRDVLDSRGRKTMAAGSAS